MCKYEAEWDTLSSYNANINQFNQLISQNSGSSGLFLERKNQLAASQMSSCLFLKEPSPISLQTAGIKHQKTVSISAAVGSFQASTQHSVPHRLCFGNCVSAALTTSTSFPLLLSHTHRDICFSAICSQPMGGMTLGCITEGGPGISRPGFQALHSINELNGFFLLV